MIGFANPLFFLLLLLIPLLVFLYFRNYRTGILFSTTKNAKQVKKSLKQKLLQTPLVLRILVLLFTVIALARPQSGKELVHDISKGVAIEMVVDHSGSMQLMKDIKGKTYTRLDIVKQVFKEFVSGNQKNLKGRINDLIGMIVFARYADTVCPLTLSHNALNKFIDQVSIVKLQSEDGTSIGDGIALAAARLKNAELTLSQQTEKAAKDYEIKSKIIILLTDGQDTGIGKRTPLEAAQLAKDWGIKIYAIGLSGRGWYFIQENPFWGKQKVPYNQQLDPSELKKAAEITGGFFRLAEDMDSLRDVYKEIDKMEKSDIESVKYMEYKELYFPFALIALILLLAEIILSNTVFRRIP
ncbi:MAG: VWA domain-containing protein [Spirochaetes bacterium]|nr:VWA domain-containing protein [Spirochaetota bacterium]